MSGNGASGKHAKAIAALLSSGSISAAAQKAEIGESTLRRWLADDTFRADLARAEGELIDGSVRKLLLLQDAALGVVGSILVDKTAAPAVRLRAAALALDGLLKLRELRDVEGRLSALEVAYAQKGDS